jgi:hypothetical protein
MHGHGQFERIHLWRALPVALILGAAGVVFSACAIAPMPPTYAQADLQAACQRQGGWWRTNLFLGTDGLCEIQAPGGGGGRH